MRLHGGCELLILNYRGYYDGCKAGCKLNDFVDVD